MNGRTSVSEATPSTARGPENGSLPLPLAAVRPIAKMTPQAAASRGSAGLVMADPFDALVAEGSDATKGQPGLSSAVAANMTPPRGGTAVPPSGGCSPVLSRCMFLA